MDILVPDSGSRHHSIKEKRPGEARLWGLVGAALVLGILFLVGAFERNDRVQVASQEPVIVQPVPAPLITNPALE